MAYYDVTPEGNFEGKNILHVKQSPERVAEDEEVSWNACRFFTTQSKMLFNVREHRVKPALMRKY